MLLRGRDTPAGMTIPLRKKKLRKYDMFIYVDSFTKMPISVESAGWMPHLDISCEIEPKQNLYSGYHSVSQTHISIISILEKEIEYSKIVDSYTRLNPFNIKSDYHSSNDIISLIDFNIGSQIENYSNVDFNYKSYKSIFNNSEVNPYSYYHADFFLDIKTSEKETTFSFYSPNTEILNDFNFFVEYNFINIDKSQTILSPKLDFEPYNLFEVSPDIEYFNEYLDIVSPDIEYTKDSNYTLYSKIKHFEYTKQYSDSYFDFIEPVFESEYYDIIGNILRFDNIVPSQEYFHFYFGYSDALIYKNIKTNKPSINFDFTDNIKKQEGIEYNYSVNYFSGFENTEKTYEHEKKLTFVVFDHWIQNDNTEYHSNELEFVKFNKPDELYSINVDQSESRLEISKRKSEEAKNKRWLYNPEYFRPFTLHIVDIPKYKKLPPKVILPPPSKYTPKKTFSVPNFRNIIRKFILPKPSIWGRKKSFLIRFINYNNIKQNRIILVKFKSGKYVPFNIEKLKINRKFKNVLIEILYHYEFKRKLIDKTKRYNNEYEFLINVNKSTPHKFNMEFKNKFGQGSGANGSIWSGYSGANIINAFRKLSTYLDGPRGLKQDYEKAVKWIQSKRDYYELRGINVDDALSPIQVLESKINPFNKKVIGPYIESSLIKRFNFGAKHKSIGFYREKEIPMPQFSSISRYRPQSNKIERTIDVLEYKAFKFFNQQEIPIADRRYRFATDLETSTKLPLSLKTNFLDYDARSYEIPRLDIMKAKGIRNDVVYGMFGETIDYFTKKPTDGKYQIDTGTNIQVKSDPARYDEYGNYIGDGAVFVEIPIKTYALNINEDFMFEYDITYRVRKNWSLDRDEPVIEDHREDGEVNIESIESRLKYYLDQGWLSLDDYDGYITRDNNGEILVHDDLVKEIDLLSESQRFMNERELLDILGKSLKTILLERAERRRGNS